MNAKVLLVDDYPGVRDSLGRALRSVGYDVTLASNGREALEFLRHARFDLVLLDLDMPVVNGWDTLEHIIALHPALPVIPITGRPGHQPLSSQKHVAAALEKPLDLSVLLREMELSLTESAARRLRKPDGEAARRQARPETAGPPLDAEPMAEPDPPRKDWAPGDSLIKLAVTSARASSVMPGAFFFPARALAFWWRG
jgi:CheY-like chemotaxis protein